MEWCCLYCEERDQFFSHDVVDKGGIIEVAVYSLAYIMEGLSRGTVMYKVRPIDRCYRRKYKVDIQNMRLSYSPSNKPFWRDKVSAVLKCSTYKRKTSVDLFELEEVRMGWNSDVFNRLEARFRRPMATFSPLLRPMLKEENCFSLVLGPSHAMVDLIAPNIETRNAWVRGLKHLIACCKSAHLSHEYDRWLKEQVRKADVNSNGSLNFEECLLLLNQLNISMRKKDAKRLFDTSNFRKVKIDGEDALDADEFVSFYHSLIHRPEIEDLMKKYSVSRSTLWGPEELQTFLQKEQQVFATRKECLSMIEKFEPEGDKIEGFLSLRGFQQALLSVDFNIFNKKHRIIYQDMREPLSHYYIASSHNTYLVQDQLIGQSSIEGYIRALTSGCRCIELDVWDGTDDEPIIFHGHTLTSRILLRDVLDAIKQYAFNASQYPVILSIENHCSVDQQIKMANLFTSILGEYLYKDPVNEKEVQFPSPEALARKILIKGKKLKETQASADFYVEIEEHQVAQTSTMTAATPPQSSAMKAEATPKTSPMKAEATPKASPMKAEGTPMTSVMMAEDPSKSSAMKAAASSHTAALAAEATSHSNEDNSLEPPMAAPTRSKMIAKELSDLINYCSAEKFQSFEECKESWKFYEMASFQESTALNLGFTTGVDFVSYNKRNLSRIYPKATRADSSNYDPLPYWNFGCQMVALNYQTDDQHMYIHEAKFSQNGRCGYILKPKYLRDKDMSYDPNEVPHPGYEHRVKIKVISGQYIPKPNKSLEGEVVDPYVSIKVTGHPLDEQKQKTKHINNNGFNPSWNEIMTFRLKAPETAMFSFRVKDESTLGKNELLGQFALPYTSITEGYRYVHLQDSKGESLIPAAIFVHVEVETSVSQ